MYIVWGLIMAAIGSFMSVCSFTKSDFVIYRLLCARSRILWGDAVHRFYQVAHVIRKFLSSHDGCVPTADLEHICRGWELLVPLHRSRPQHSNWRPLRRPC